MRDYGIALLLLCGLSLWTLGSAQAPGEVDYATVMSSVVDLIRVNVSWAVPTGFNITSYNVTFCNSDNNCGNVVAVFPGASGRVSLPLMHNGAVGTSIRISIAASNDEGMAPFGPGRTIPVATLDDARPVVTVPVLTDSFLLVSWSLPAKARGEGITLASYSVATMPASTTKTTTSAPLAVTFSSSEFSGSPFSGPINIIVTPSYTTPIITGDVAGTMSVTVPTSAAVTSILGRSGTVNMEGSTPTTTVFTWLAPPNGVTALVEGYNVSYSSSVENDPDSSRRRRNTMGTTSFTAQSGATSVDLATCAYCNVVVDVTAEFPSGLTAPLLDTSSFRTDTGRPTAPRDFAVVNDGIRNLKCNWTSPNPTNGIITNYIVIFSAGGESRREGAGGNILTYTILNLLPNTEYTVEVLALTSAGEGPATSSFTRTTGFGVTSPTIDKVDGRDITFTLPTSDGGVSRYVIVVSKEVPSNTEAITNIPAYSQGASLYVTRAGRAFNGTITIGTGETEGGSVTYTDAELSGSVYVFIRAYSSINTEVFADSSSDQVSTGGGVPIVAIVVPIVVVYIIIMIILIVLGVLAYIYVGNARKLRKKYQLRKQEAERRKKALEESAAVNLVNDEEGGGSPPPKNLGEGGAVTMGDVKGAEDVVSGDEEKTADS